MYKHWLWNGYITNIINKGSIHDVNYKYGSDLQKYRYYRNLIKKLYNKIKHK